MNTKQSTKCVSDSVEQSVSVDEPVGTLAVFDDAESDLGWSYDISANLEQHKRLSKLNGANLYTTPQPKQEQGEPVAWRWKVGNSGWQLEDVQPRSPTAQPLYTTPQQPSTIVRIWVGLTAEEVSIIEHKAYSQTIQKGKHMSVFITQFAKALESALKAKNT